MSNDKSIFNLSLVELVLVVFFMYMVITVYQLSYKTSHINELNKIVESEREITKELVKKEYPKLEKRVAELVNLEKYKKLNQELLNNNSGVFYIKNQIIDNIKNADRLKDYNKYEDLIAQKNKLRTQILDLKNNTLTINTLNELNLQDAPLHKQIQYLQRKVKDNYRNKLDMSNRLKTLRSNETIRYILLKLNKYDAPVGEQLKAIENELKKFDKTLTMKNYSLDKNYDANTKYILEKLKHNNKPIDSQINALKQTLENQKLLSQIKILEKQLENALKGSKYTMDTSNIQKAINNLQDIKSNINGKYETNTNDILRELKQSNKSLDDQINHLKKELELSNKNRELENTIKNLQRELDKRVSGPNIKSENIQKALENLQDIKNGTSSEFNQNTKDILKELNQEVKPLDKQISELKKELELAQKGKDLEQKIDGIKKQIANNNELKNSNKSSKNLQKALDNLQDIKKSATYDPNTKEILKELKQSSQPLDKQIIELKKELDSANKNKDLQDMIKELKKQIDKDIKVDDPKISNGLIQKAIDDLQKIQNDADVKYDPQTNNILKELKQEGKPLDEQIANLKKELELKQKGKELEDRIKELKNKLDKNISNDPALRDKSIQKALDKLQDIKEKSQYKPNTKEIIKELGDNDKSLDKQIEKLKKELELAKKGKELEDKIKELQKQLDKNSSKYPNIENNDIQKVLQNLEKIANDPNEKYNSNTKEILKELGQSDKPLDKQIENLKKELELGKKAKDIEQKIEDIKKQIANNNDLKNTDQSSDKLQKALNDLQDIKQNSKYDKDTKEILKKLGLDGGNLDKQIKDLKQRLGRSNINNDLQKQIEELKEQLDNTKTSANIDADKIREVLENLERLKGDSGSDKNFYLDKLKDALDGVKEIQKIKDKLSSDRNYKPTINTSIEETIKYLEDKAKDPKLQPSEDVRSVLDRFKIEGKPSDEQISDLYLHLYSTPPSSTNISELNFVINRLNDQDDLENKIERINEILQNIHKPKNIYEERDGIKGQDKESIKEIATLKNQIKYLQKKIEQSGKVHMPCFLSDEGSTIYLFKLFLREDSIYVQLGWHEEVEQMAKGLPNLDKLLDQTMSLDEFMKLTKPIFEKSVKDECRHFVYFEDETVSKREYKRKTLTIQHHFYKYIDHSW